MYIQTFENDGNIIKLYYNYLFYAETRIILKNFFENCIWVLKNRDK